ncbi:MAG: GNAT family N-acetyltransferase [Anaerolineales bacterium]|nr:GNAT family N-acetyltransferase [Anaerolineales bacterium]MCX7755476.1 GNAT family N-acetyltransferase [Anaerolineales bacterium]MDW8278274.1 GNAT family N-acetyltransferase [Anaerolineales bacterium]
MNNLQILEITPERMADYEAISPAFEVREMLAVFTPGDGLGGIHLVPQRVVTPYIKDYDAFGPPRLWLAEFNTANWGFFLAEQEGLPVGAAAVAWNTNGVDMLEGRRDLSVLWDLRVRPEWRKRGVGKALFQYAAAWSRSRGCVMMKIETQNINLPACRFYVAQGCVLGDIRRFAYRHIPEAADEVQLNWYFRL